MKPSSAAFTLMFFCSLTMAACSFERADYPPIIAAEQANALPSPEQRIWALSLAAVMVERNQGRLDLLGGSERTPETIEEDRELLADWWGVQSRDDLLAKLAWIKRGGHRRAFDELSEELAKVPQGKIEELKASADPEFRNKVTTVLENRGVMDGKSIAGWDFGRYVALCGWGFVAGYLTEEEAWQLIMPVARKMQTTFGSWEEFGKNYMIGRQFWSFSESRSDSGKLVGQAYMRLVFRKDSPWVQVPWNVDLGGKDMGAKAQSIEH